VLLPAEPSGADEPAGFASVFVDEVDPALGVPSPLLPAVDDRRL
jgi:hypothetical protein